MNPWPWKRLRDFRGRTRFAALMKKAGGLLLIVAAILSPLGIVLHIVGYARWRFVNDNWHSRPLLLLATGAIGTYAVNTLHPGGIIGVYDTLLRSFPTPDQVPSAVTAWLLLGTFPSLVLASISGAGYALTYEHDQKAWIRPMRTNLRMRIREFVNSRRIASGAKVARGFIVFGLLAGDTLPWGDGRRGAIVARSSKNIGHGFILGQQGSGKTAEALNIADQFIEHKFSMVFPDFKGDSITRQALKASAEHAGLPFYAFSFTPMHGDENVHYDPLDWEGSANDKAALIIKALPFPAEDSAAAYYRTKAEAYLPLQFEILDLVGLKPGEGTFDFLLDTVSPEGLRQRLQPLRGQDDMAALYSTLMASINTHTAKDLEGLKGNLNKVVNAGGKYLRPATGNGVTLNLRDAVNEGAVIYFELASTLDAVSSITMGTLLMQDVIAMIGQRAKASNKNFRDVILMSDEASTLGVRADIMDEISKQGRSSKVWNWVITQSIVTWPETTRREIVNNATVRIVFNMQEEESQLLLTGGMPESFYINVRKGFDMHDSMLGESAHKSGSSGTEEVIQDKQLRPGDIGNLPNRRAWIWVSGADEKVKLVQGWARNRTLPVRHEAPSEVLKIKPVLRNRIANVLSGKEAVSELSGAETSGYDDSVEFMATPEDWMPEALPAPPQMTHEGAVEDPGQPTPGGPARAPEASAEVLSAQEQWNEAVYENTDGGEPGSMPLSVTLSRARKGATGNTVRHETSPAVKALKPRPDPAREKPAGSHWTTASQPPALSSSKVTEPPVADASPTPEPAKLNPLLAPPQSKTRSSSSKTGTSSKTPTRKAANPGEAESWGTPVPSKASSAPPRPKPGDPQAADPQAETDPTT